MVIFGKVESAKKFTFYSVNGNFLRQYIPNKFRLLIKKNYWIKR